MTNKGSTIAKVRLLQPELEILNSLWGLGTEED
jgi:hypothetical protein